MLWVDDFTTDHFADRYRLIHGLKGTNPSDGSFYLADGLHPHYVMWNDENAHLGDGLVAWMELRLSNWTVRSIAARIGFTAPGLGVGDGSPFEGVWMQLNHAGLPPDFGPHGTLQVTLIANSDPANPVSAFYAGDTHFEDPSSEIIMRLAIDDAGVAYWGLAAGNGGFDPGTGSRAVNLGGFGQLNETAVGRAPGWVPGASVAASELGDDGPMMTVGLWKYEVGIAAPNSPGELAVAAGANGILRSGPQPATPGLRGSFS